MLNIKEFYFCKYKDISIAIHFFFLVHLLFAVTSVFRLNTSRTFLPHSVDQVDVNSPVMLWMHWLAVFFF